MSAGSAFDDTASIASARSSLASESLSIEPGKLWVCPQVSIMLTTGPSKLVTGRALPLERIILPTKAECLPSSPTPAGKRGLFKKTSARVVLPPTQENPAADPRSPFEP